MKIIKILYPAFLVGILLSSCEDYLDQAPEAVIDEKDIFSNVLTYQGYVEDIYQGVVDVTIGGQVDINFNFGDDVICSKNTSLDKAFDRGDNWAWMRGGESPYLGNQNYANDNERSDTRGIWDSGWGGIRKANIGLNKLDDLVNATNEEKKLIEGQLYFFRGYYHYDILKSWGGIPYVTEVFLPSDEMRLKRLTYQQTADSIANDLKKAIELLPVNWDQTEMGQATNGQNKGRLVKGAAYGYLGKNYLYAGSPLMNGSTDTDGYNLDYCQKAAEAFAEVIKLADQGVYELLSWEKYSDNFYRMDQVSPNSKEYVFNNPSFGFPDKKDGGKMWERGEFILLQLQGYGCVASPTENYVENFGMANGLPITDPNSGYDPNNPWLNRDPRFYYNIVIDGERIVKKNAGADTYAQFYIGGRHRDPSVNVSTGYIHKKFRDITCNKFDKGWGNWRGHNWNWECPNMRLADVYLMYAEAVNEVLGPDGSINGGPTALEAVNIVRQRAGIPDVAPQYHLDKNALRQTIRQERAVELAFEAHRYDDLRRWKLASLPEYKEKYALEFDKEHTYFKKVLFATRVFDEKHYWLPFPQEQVNLYPELQQNPGW
ncbi:RagB/SusD family nutrient uptake outer membrane protein [uncultured Draconibacterium sp.]|uniref:RagB/SusD family nutrient uptake outer membrane protein n=1 Tax=uncultured Draconibacterium sp. TaxID=1573823 RepID=UPI0029C8AC80|nr:RagB/SusD family nutrient uptake outer membrane protein [uncultured Draconibacterium sp.]